MQNWKLRQLLEWHFVMAILIGTFFWAPTEVLWKKLDIALFRLLNSPLPEHSSLQIFWALANHKMADWVEDIFILGFYAVLIRHTARSLRLKKAAELLFCALLIGAIIYFINRQLFRHYWKIPRESPTLVVDGAVRLSDLIPWLHIKDDSSKSFPGDHGTTALLFSASYCFLAGWRLGIIAIVYGAFLCLPRLVTGAHWLSDVIIGSGCITIFFLSWAFCTPFFQKCSEGILRLFLLFAPRKNEENPQEEKG